MSETHCRADQPPVLPAVDGFTVWNTERSGSDKGGGGLSILYKDTLTAHQWSPAVPDTLDYVKNERQWLLLNSQSGKKCAFLHCYIACQNFASDSFIQWNEDLFHLLTTEAINLRRQGFMVICLGDFNTRVGQIEGLEENTPDTNRNEPMFTGFVSEVNLFIMNTLPMSKGLFTRFMGGSGVPGTASLLDYGLIDSDHVNNVRSFTIDEQARFDCGSDHALLECDIVMDSSPHINWSYHDVLHYNFTENSDFTEYQKTLDSNITTIPLCKFEGLGTSEMLTHVTESFNSSAKKTFGLKMKKQKKGISLPKEIVGQIQAKNHLARSLHNAAFLQTSEEINQLQLKLDTLKQQIKDKISDFKLRKRQHQRSKLLKADPSRKRFWKFLKSQIKSAGQISAVYKVKYIIKETLTTI